MNRMTEPAHIRFSSPYLVFCREQRPLLPAHLTNSDRERLLGQNWRKLSKAGSAAYTRGLTQLITTGRGGFREWAPTPPTKLPTPPSAATFLAGCAAADSVAVSVCASVSAERTAKTAPPYPDPEDQPAAKRRAFSTAATRRAYQDGQGYALRVENALAVRLAADRHAHSAPAASLLPLAVEQAVAPQGGGGGTGGGKSESSLERGYSDQRAFKRWSALLTQTKSRQGEGGHSEGELERILQEQLARLRSSWYCAPGIGAAPPARHQ